jgi:hypothetical protein
MRRNRQYGEWEWLVFKAEAGTTQPALLLAPELELELEPVPASLGHGGPPPLVVHSPASS